MSNDPSNDAPSTAEGTGGRVRTIESSPRMSEHEALMWAVEADPWMSPSGAALVLLDQPIDAERFRATMRHAVAVMPRLRQVVEPDSSLLSTPSWAPVETFDLDDHLQSVTLENGDERALYDLASELYAQGLDRTKPLWRFVMIDGLDHDFAAMWMLTHHVVADGIGQMRMAELYQSISPDGPVAPEVDLDAIIAEARAAHEAQADGGEDSTPDLKAVAGTAFGLAKFQFDMTRKLAGELAILPTDPGRIGDRVDDLMSMARGSIGQLIGSGDDEDASSPIWKTRSDQRVLDHVRLPLDQLKKAAKSQGSTINDAFLAGMVDAVVRYHEQRDVPLSGVNASFVLSTRRDNAAGGNSFTPVGLTLDGAAMTMAERISDIHEKVAAKRADAQKGGGLTALSGVARRLPTSVLSRAARSQSARIDVATSNLRSAPFPLYVANARVIGTVPQGPLAGTPCNATALSSENRFDIGLVMDPVAIAEPAAFRQCVADAFEDLLALA